MSWITGFFADWNGEPVGSVPYSKYTHLIHFAAEPGPNGTVNAAAINTSIASTFTANAHAAGAKALYSITSNGSNFPPNASSSTRSTFISNLIGFMNTYGYDGIDLDWESNINIADYAALIVQLRSALPTGKLLTISAYGGGGGTPLDAVLQAGASHLDQVNMMTYDQDIFANGSWFNTAIHSGSTGNPSIESEFNDFRTRGGGIPASKLGIGIPFYGRRYTGVNGPAQSGGSRQNSPFYRDLVAQGRVPSSAEQYNSTYGGAYLSYSGEFWPYTSTGQIGNIVTYGNSVGVGGFFVFSVEQEWISGASGDARYPLSTALVSAIGGTPTSSLPVIYSFAADATAVTSGGPVTFSFLTGNATSLSINGTTVTGTSHTFNPTTATDYVLTATNTDGSVTSSTVHVAIGTGAPTISSFTATPANFVPEQAVTLSWVQSLGTSASIDQGVGSVTGLSSKVVNPTATTTYTLTVANGTSPDATRSITVTLGSAPPVINSFSASSTSIAPGDPVTLSFSAGGFGPGTTALSLNGVPVFGPSVIVSPLATTRYTLIASNGSGSVSQSITIDVIGPSPNNLRIWQVRDGDKHGTLDFFQISDGTGEENHFAKYLLDGSVTNSALKESDVLSLITNSGTGLTTAGQNSWYGQVPRGTINGTNTTFFLDYKLANPYAVLQLNGVGQLPDVQGDPANPLSTMVVGNSEFSITNTTLSVVNPPRPAERFYIYYFRKDAVVITGASITIWTAWRNEGSAFPQAIYYSPVQSPHYNGFGSFDGGTGIVSLPVDGPYSLKSDTTVISTSTGTPADYLGAKVLFTLVGTLPGNATPSVAFDIYDIYLTLTLADGTFQTLRPKSFTFATGSDLSMTAWAPATNYPAGAYVIDANGNVQLAQNTGTSGAAVPSWSTSGNTTDGSIVWAYQGLQTSQTGQIQDPTLAYDAEGVLPPTTRAIFSRIHYSGFADPGNVTYIF